MEVLYDLDEEARHLCEELGLSMVRSRTVGTHRGFVRMLRELIDERVSQAPIDERRALGPVRPEPRRLPGRLLPAPGSAPFGCPAASLARAPLASRRGRFDHRDVFRSIERFERADFAAQSGRN